MFVFYEMTSVFCVLCYRKCVRNTKQNRSVSANTITEHKCVCANTNTEHKCVCAKADLNSSPSNSCPEAYSANGCSNGFEKHLPFMGVLVHFNGIMVIVNDWIQRTAGS